MEKSEYRGYIKQRTKLFDAPATIHKDLQVLYGDKAPSYSTVLRCSHKVQEGNMEIEDQFRSGRPKSKVITENIELVQRLIEEEPHSSISDLVEATTLSTGTIFTILHEELGMRKLAARWVHHELTEFQR
jgi:hypothetical protein